MLTISEKKNITHSFQLSIVFHAVKKYSQSVASLILICIKSYCFWLLFLFVAKSHYSQEAPHRLSLTTGDAIIIKGESENWYFGYKKDDRHQRGIFPKTYVVVVDASKSYDGSRDTYSIRRSPIVEEITTILKEWHNHFIKLYLVSRIFVS